MILRTQLWTTRSGWRWPNSGPFQPNPSIIQRKTSPQITNPPKPAAPAKWQRGLGRILRGSSPKFTSIFGRFLAVSALPALALLPHQLPQHLLHLAPAGRLQDEPQLAP
uniref:Uncharacterized protein n=1 Tax=Strix occidentalis caurina TaxID=311401 RepID=A0A8D0EUA7_STROC